MSKLKFNITEIPEGDSHRAVTLAPEYFDFDTCRFKGADVDIDFYRAQRFIQAKCAIKADVELICDRCLEPFMERVTSSYDVVFKTDVAEETEDENGAIRRFDFSTNSFSIEQEIRDSIMLKIPMRTIHPKYLDENGEIKTFESKSFGKDLAAEEEKSHTDPRWNKLKELKDNT